MRKFRRNKSPLIETPNTVENMPILPEVLDSFQIFMQVPEIEMEIFASGMSGTPDAKWLENLLQRAYVAGWENGAEAALDDRYSS